jgi:hypothetical protein
VFCLEQSRLIEREKYSRQILASKSAHKKLTISRKMIAHTIAERAQNANELWRPAADFIS